MDQKKLLRRGKNLFCGSPTLEPLHMRSESFGACWVQPPARQKQNGVNKHLIFGQDITQIGLSKIFKPSSTSTTAE